MTLQSSSELLELHKHLEQMQSFQQFLQERVDRSVAAVDRSLRIHCYWQDGE